MPCLPDNQRKKGDDGVEGWRVCQAGLYYIFTEFVIIREFGMRSSLDVLKWN
jgi:hypothetical protein